MGLKIKVLEDSFNLIAPQGEALVARFYERLFEKYPAVKPLFKGVNIKKQQKKLLASLVLVVTHLRKPAQLTKALHGLGARHVGYGTEPAHYDAVNENLLAVLGEFAGEAWTPKVKKAWAEALTAIKTIMLEGAEQFEKGGKVMGSTATDRKGKNKGSIDKVMALTSAALNDVQGNIMICDRDLKIIYANKASVKTLKSVEAVIQESIPAFSVDDVVGSCIDMYHKFPERQRRLLSDPSNLPHKADITIGPLTLELNVNAIMDNGEYMGNIVEWEEVSAKRKLESERQIFVTALQSAGTNIMISDAEDKVIFVNKAAISTLQKVDAELKENIPGYDLSKVMGSSIHGNHKDPGRIKQILGGLGQGDVRAGEITPGDLIFVHQTRGIFNDKGEKIAHMVEWRDATSERRAQSEVERMINAASEGNLSERIDAGSFEGFYKTISEGINKMITAVQEPLKEAQEVLQGLAEGDLRNQMTGDYQGTFGNIKENLNGAMAKLSDTLSSVRSAAEVVTNGVAEISHGNDDLSQRTSEQASSLEETSSSMEEMTSTVKQNADNAKQANQLAVAARDIAGKGGEVTAQTITAMAEVNKSSKKIVDIISVIDEIAFQTNLLALNAAVEAARAGEHGRGFAVVAAEVRNLAQRSATAAKEIKSLINESVQQVTDSSNLVNQSGKTLEEIVESVKRVTDVIGEISAASQEQSAGIDQVNKAIMQMDETTQQNAALVEEAASTSHGIKDQGEELLHQVAFFKFEDVEDDYDRRPRREAPERRQPGREARYESVGGRERQRATQRPAPRAYAPASRRPEARPVASATRRPENGNGHGNGPKREVDEFDEF